MHLMVVAGIVLSVSCCMTEARAARGDKFKKYFIDYDDSVKSETKSDTKIREPRHHKWSRNNANVDLTLPPTTTTTTKSPQQLQKEKEAAQKRNNPKGFLIGKNKEKNKGKEIIFKKSPSTSVDKNPYSIGAEMKKMKEDLLNMQSLCLTNADCTNATCCLITNGVGRCSLRPYREGQPCIDQCGCAGVLVCKELDRQLGAVTKATKHCQLNEEDYARDLIARIRLGKKNTLG